jgi:hypothetical protein
MQEKWGAYYAWDYNEIKRAFEYEGLKWVGESVNKPLIIGECGANLGWKDSNPDEYQKEIIAWNNTLAIFNEWGLHYQAFWWRNIGIYRLLEQGQPWVPPPTESGEILIKAIKA